MTKPTDEQIWAAVFAAAFVAEARDHAVTRGQGWREFTSGTKELPIGTAGDAATLADCAVEAYHNSED